MKTCLFPVHLINIKNVINVFNVFIKEPFLCRINRFRPKTLQTDTNQSTLNREIQGTTLRYSIFTKDNLNNNSG